MNGVPHAIFRRWTHSREEDAPGVTVFRPTDFPFPPSRGRAGIEFQPDGGFVDWSAGAADVPQGTPGRWQAAAMNRVVVSFPDQRPARTFEILECSDQILKLREV